MTLLRSQTSGGRSIESIPLRPLLGWLLIGLAVRLVFLPLTVHPDTVAVFYRMGEWRVGRFDVYSFGLQGLPLWLHGLWAELTQVPLPESAWIHWSTASVSEVRETLVTELSRPGAVWHVALWKLPYALADLACAVLVARLVARAAGVGRALFALRIWLLFPVFVYMSSLFGKYESFMLLPLLLGFTNWQRGRDERAFVWFGVAIAMRLYPALLLLPFVLVASASWRRRIELAVLAVLPLGLVLVTAALRSSLAVAGLVVLLVLAWHLYVHLRRTRIERLVGGLIGAGVLAAAVVLVPKVLHHLSEGSGAAGPVLSHARALAGTVIEVSKGDTILLAYLIYGLACLWAHNAAAVRASGSRPGFGELLDAGLLASLALFSFSGLNPQYFTLYFALAVVRLGCSSVGAGPLAVQLVGFFFYLAFAAGGSTSVGLFMPVSPRLVSLIPDLLHILPMGLDDPGPISIGRTLFLFGSIWMAWELLRSRHQQARRAGSSWALGAAFVVWPLLLVLLLWLPFRGVFERPGPWRPADVKIDGSTPLDNAQISTWGGIPVAIELMRDAAQLKPGESPGNTYLVVNEDQPSEKAIELVIASDKLTADTNGVTRVPLGAPGFLPDRKYRLIWTGLNPAARLPLIARPIFETDGSEALGKVGSDFELRYFEQTHAGLTFFGLAGLALLLGAGLLLGPRLSRSSR